MYYEISHVIVFIFIELFLHRYNLHDYVEVKITSARGKIQHFYALVSSILSFFEVCYSRPTDAEGCMVIYVISKRFWSLEGTVYKKVYICIFVSKLV